MVEPLSLFIRPTPTEMFSDWIIDLIDCGAITCAKKSLNRGKVVASFCMGSQRLYDYIDNNPFFEFSRDLV